MGDEGANDDYAVLPFMAQDLLYLRPEARSAADDVLYATPVNDVTVRGEGPFMDGPAVARVAVVDTDDETGRHRPPARLNPRRGRRRTYHLDVEPDADSPPEAFGSDTFIQVSTFAAVMRTVMFFEGPDALARRIPWSCTSPLQIVPRAGLDANAFYDRDEASLKFFSFPSTTGSMVHAALSHDVVTHETSHALLDGIAPDLYTAITPQSLAIHEAVADLAAIALTILNEQVVFSLFNISGGGLDGAEVLSRVADEFGAARHAVGANYLRSASNARTLDAADPSRDAAGVPNAVDDIEPHGLAEILSGAVYSTFRNHFDELAATESGERATSLAGKRTIRMVFRALDHLPPGELSFADVGRAIVAADAVGGGRALDRRRLAAEFVRRGIVRSASELETPVDIDIGDETDLDLGLLLADDGAARAFAERQRTMLGIPVDRAFEVLPRHYLGTTGAAPHRQLSFRVRWTAVEEHEVGPAFGRQWVVPSGTTVILDATQGARAVTLLTSDQSDAQREARGQLLRRETGAGRLMPDDAADREAVRDMKLAVGAPGPQRVSGTGRFLHVIEPEPSRVGSDGQP